MAWGKTRDNYVMVTIDTARDTFRSTSSQNFFGMSSLPSAFQSFSLQSLKEHNEYKSLCEERERRRMDISDSQVSEAEARYRKACEMEDEAYASKASSQLDLTHNP